MSSLRTPRGISWQWQPPGLGPLLPNPEGRQAGWLSWPAWDWLWGLLHCWFSKCGPWTTATIIRTVTSEMQIPEASPVLPSHTLWGRELGCYTCNQLSGYFSCSLGLRATASNAGSLLTYLHALGGCCGFQSRQVYIGEVNVDGRRTEAVEIHS